MGFEEKQNDLKKQINLFNLQSITIIIFKQTNT